MDYFGSAKRPDVRALQDWTRFAKQLGSGDVSIKYVASDEQIKQAFLATLYSHRMGERFRASQELMSIVDQWDNRQNMERREARIKREANEWWNVLMANDPDHVTGMKYLDAIFRAAPKDSLVFEKFGQIGTCLLSNINDATRPDEWRILLALRTLPQVTHTTLMTARKNTLFMIRKGFMGTGPKSICSGDLVALVPGLNIPLIFREAGDGEQHYRLVSGAYIHGIMAGEAVHILADPDKLTQYSLM